MKPTYAIVLLVSLLTAGSVSADPLSKKIDVDFFRSAQSRNLHGFAARSDGRLTAGPVYAELAGQPPADLLWCLEPQPGGTWLVGTGPDGKIFEISPDLSKRTYVFREIVRLDDTNVLAVKRLSDGSILAGTSPHGELVLVRGGKVAARANLAADSIFDILLQPAATGPGSALVATGNPGIIYKVDLAAFAATSQGIAVFGRIRDRNVRRIASLADGRIAAGSSPQGNIYTFPSSGGAPFILQENKDGEVTDLLPQPDGELFATIVFASRPPAAAQAGAEKQGESAAAIPPPAQPEKFDGRSMLVRFTKDSFPDNLVTRLNGTFYRMARRGNAMLVVGGELGDFTGYNLDERLALTYSGSPSARINDLEPVPGSPDRYLALHNNAAGLALVDFSGGGPRTAETDSFDLGSEAALGALRIERLRELDPARLQVEIKAGNASEDAEGWSPWVTLTEADNGWGGESLKGRYVKFRLTVPAPAAGNLEINSGAFYYLPQNRRPVLQEFHFVSPNYGLVPAPEPAPQTVTTLSQLLQPKDEDKHKTFLSSQVVPVRGAQVAFWTINAADGENVVCTFSIRRDGDPNWTDILVASTDSYVQFDTTRFPDGIYFTRLVAKQVAPRSPEDRLSATFETDNLVIDHTPPDILEATLRRTASSVIIRIHGRDALSLLEGIEVKFNNGLTDSVEQPVDGIRDSRDKTFELEEPLDKVAGATVAEVTLFDACANGATRRLAVPAQP